MTESIERGHIRALDGVRGIAILLVLVAHMTIWGRSAADIASRNVALLGFSGVDLFFVLSGFLITRLLWFEFAPARQGHERGAGLRRFWTRRVLRIFPLYLAVLVALFVILPLFKPWTEYPMPAVWDARWYYWLHATNIRAAVQHSLDLPYNTGHFWSLAVEEQFYLLWPFVIRRIRTLDGLLRIALWTIAGAWILRLTVGGVFDNPVAAYVLMPTRMDGLALGGAIFALSAQGRLQVWRVPARFLGAATFVVATLLMPVHRSSGWADVSMGLAATLFHASFMTLVLTGSAARVDRPWLRMFGRYSYGIYVIHFPLLLLLAPRMTWTRALPSMGGWSLPTAVVYFLCGTTISTALAVVSYHVFEKRFLLLKDKLAPPPQLRTSSGAVLSDGGFTHAVHKANTP